MLLRLRNYLMRWISHTCVRYEIQVKICSYHRWIWQIVCLTLIARLSLWSPNTAHGNPDLAGINYCHFIVLIFSQIACWNVEQFSLLFHQFGDTEQDVGISILLTISFSNFLSSHWWVAKITYQHFNQSVHRCKTLSNLLIIIRGDQLCQKKSDLSDFQLFG